MQRGRPSETDEAAANPLPPVSAAEAATAPTLTLPRRRERGQRPSENCFQTASADADLRNQNDIFRLP
ncbi:hypothetical protein [Kingella potus]|nr:hypothetical protein [Kingella potus]